MSLEGSDFFLLVMNFYSDFRCNLTPAATRLSSWPGSMTGNTRGVGHDVLMQTASCSMHTPFTRWNTLSGNKAPNIKAGTSAVIGENLDCF